jgi:Flp pilus assembly secretin CpaC
MIIKTINSMFRGVPGLFIGLLLTVLLAGPVFADKMVVPLGKAVSLKISGVTKIMAVKDGVVEVLNVSDDEVIISGVGNAPGTTQIIFWSDKGKTVYDVETYNETQVIQEKFVSFFPDPGVSVQFFPDAVYLRGMVDSPDKVKEAETVLSKLVTGLPVVNLLDFKEGITVQQRIIDAIKIPTVRVTVIDPQEELSKSSDSSTPTSVATGTTDDIRVILEGTVFDQNEYIRLVEVAKSFVKDQDKISNLVVISDPLQVVFQAYILSVRKDKSRETGIQWGGTDGVGGTNFSLGQLNFFENSSNVFRGDTQANAAPVDSWPNPFKFNNLNRFDLITAQVKALEQKNYAKVLSNPKLVVYANASKQKIAETGWKGEKELGAGTADTSIAYVNVGEKIPYNKGNDNNGTPQIEYIEAFLTLAVRDLFIDGENLKFSVFAKQANRSGEVANTPIVSQRELMSTVRVKNEETIVLGGLINTDKTVVDTKIPLLSKIPVLGRAFQWRNHSKVDSELVIILTPKILNRDFNLAGKRHFETVPVPRRSERLEELHNLFQDIKQSHFPGKNK